jgi:cytochrome c-type biogenesis protein
LFAESISISAAFVAGLLSFFSPCILPLIPAYFTFITGYSLNELTEGDPSQLRAKVVGSTVMFVLGFSLVFILFGASASMLGGLVNRYQDVLRIIGGAVIIVLGLHISGVFRIRFLDVEKRMHLSQKPVHALGTLVVGMAFGAGWSPCVGPLLGSILALAASQGTVGQGMLLLAIYSLGLAIPFLVLSLFAHLVLAFVKRGTKVIRYVNITAGILMVIVGVLLIADQLRIVG